MVSVGIFGSFEHCVHVHRLSALLVKPMPWSSSVSMHTHIHPLKWPISAITCLVLHDGNEWGKIGLFVCYIPHFIIIQFKDFIVYRFYACFCSNSFCCCLNSSDWRHLQIDIGWVYNFFDRHVLFFFFSNTKIQLTSRYGPLGWN